ncbi:MAG: trypsin-like peptidase domain-containing protein, partial [bacterium]
GGILLTAAHVVRDCVLIEAVFNGEKFPVSSMKSAELLDLAVLDTGAEGHGIATINGDAKKPMLGQQLFATGFPLSNILSAYPSLTVGNVSSLGGLKGGQGVFQFSAPVQPGNSGGSVVDYKGNLLGVVTGTLNQKMMLETTGTVSQNLNFAVDLEFIRKFLDKEAIPYTVSTKSQTFEEASAEAVDYSAQVFCYQ